MGETWVEKWWETVNGRKKKRNGIHPTSHEVDRQI